MLPQLVRVLSLLLSSLRISCLCHLIIIIIIIIIIIVVVVVVFLLRYSLFWDIKLRWRIQFCPLFGKTCMCFVDGTYFSRNVDNQLPSDTSYISEEPKPQLYFGGSLWLSHNMIYYHHYYIH
jgi:hypothetical protein